MEATIHVAREAESPAEVVSLGRRRRPRPGSAHGTASIRVLLAEGESLVRAGLRALIEHGPDVAVVAEAESGDELVELAAELGPDVVVVDVHLPGLDALEAVRRIVADDDRVNVLMVADRMPDADLFGALRAGAGGLLLRDSDPAELRRAVRTVAGGEAQLSPSLARRLIDAFTAQPAFERPAPECMAALTAREREVVALVAAGLSNREIAERLVISPATAKTHVSRAMVKLGARDRAKLVAIAYESGLAGGIRPPSASRSHIMGRSRDRTRTGKQK